MMHPAEGPCNGLFCSADGMPAGAESSFTRTDEGKRGENLKSKAALWGPPPAAVAEGDA
jgi:hypothetical protein